MKYNNSNKNALFQLSTLEAQSGNTNPNILSLDLGECEQILKEYYGINADDPLIILKAVLKSEDLSSTYVQYEIYHPNTLDRLNDQAFCKNINSKISDTNLISNSIESLSDYQAINKLNTTNIYENQQFLYLSKKYLIYLMRYLIII